MIYVMFAMAISNSNGITSITTAEFNSSLACEEARAVLIREFTSEIGGFGSVGQKGAPILKIKCLPKES